MTSRHNLCRAQNSLFSVKYRQKFKISLKNYKYWNFTGFWLIKKEHGKMVILTYFGNFLFYFGASGKNSWGGGNPLLVSLGKMRVNHVASIWWSLYSAIMKHVLEMYIFRAAHYANLEYVSETQIYTRDPRTCTILIPAGGSNWGSLP